MCVPGSPSLVGRKPGKLKYNIAMTSKLVTLNGLGGSNPSPGALVFNKKFMLISFYFKITISVAMCTLLTGPSLTIHVS